MQCYLMLPVHILTLCSMEYELAWESIKTEQALSGTVNFGMSHLTLLTDVQAQSVPSLQAST